MSISKSFKSPPAVKGGQNSGMKIAILWWERVSMNIKLYYQFYAAVSQALKFGLKSPS